MPAVGVLDFGVNGAHPSTVGGTGTAVKYFPRLIGPSIGMAPTTPSSTSALGALFLPGHNAFNNQLFEMFVAGTTGPESGDPSGTVSVQVYAVTGTLTAPVYTSIATIAAVAPLVAAAQSWAIKLNLFGSTGSGTLGGNYVPYKNGVQGTSATTTTVISGLDFNLGNPGLNGAVVGLVVGVTFGTSDATNTAKLYQFTIA